MNNIVFTQDLPGERDWISSIFPGSMNLETIDSGRWPSTEPVDQNGDYIWEIAPDHKFNADSWAGTKFKSLYQLDHSVPCSRWTDSDYLLIKNNQFSTGQKSTHALVLTVGRCGTQFLESILKNSCNYQQLVGWSDTTPLLFYPNKILHTEITHSFPYTPMHKIGVDAYSVVNKFRPDIFFVYRKNWWQWMSSSLIHNLIGHFHYYNDIKFESIEPITCTVNDIDKLAYQLKSGFNDLCHMRAHFPNLNFNVFEFSDLIKSQSITNHQQIKYNKQQLIVNYNELEQYYKDTYQSQLDIWENRFIKHLVDMKCNLRTNFDWANVDQNI